MAYTLLACLIIAIALTGVLLAGRILLKGRWFLGWLRGMCGIAIVSLSVLLVLSALDFYSYKQLSKEQSVGSISFAKLDNQHYQVSLVDSNGLEQVYEVSGDLWQLDARIIKWNQALAAMGLPPGYRLDRLSGRYLSLEKEQSASRTVYQLSRNKNIVDVWAWLHKHGRASHIVDTSYGSATYLPMADGALFSVSLSGSGLLGRPLNDRAKAAIESWQ
jgi:hypothetical protein